MSWWGSGEQDISYPELKTPTSPEELKAIADEFCEEILDTFQNDEGWNTLAYTEAGGEDIELFDKADEASPIVPVKARGIIKADAAKIFGYISEDDMAKLHENGLDPDLTALEILETHGDLSVRYSAFTVGPMISNREFVFIQVSRDLEDGSKLLATKSINRADKKQAASHVRGTIALAGMLVVPKDNGECLVHRTVQVDPKGSIPGWVVNMNKTKVATRITKIRELCSK
mmetsp:Transcript_25905/g.40433  ORF Transcript_25905/g.40433 Transcript_25905/m.40433 type:complete len:230 (-) Transcript_25905:70-759(-)|eukprot:CAMPEP_0201523418 /NCGR_PEP_ID=MMETSP0161_2-20130828/19742_1 /ASSEMBLY_ACC=CAM_ASM_000251 /TAXON_ID=180227 /ORGANISM="Neoparamoeba aestuarina, Strain SoJaBio B1-5/56/2" /LENGTH=229 /DNA_ID=CAMNT_0047922533 /DNA_START=138 /DNA_END=827 /DNA_ORIENTATION=+